MINSKPLVSVMMPAYNAGRFIADAVASVLAQTYTSWELIIVDDGSTDNTAEILARFEDPRLKVIHQANGGESTARNTALDHMQAGLVAFLDSDDQFTPDHLALTVEFLGRQPAYDAVYTDGYYIDAEGRQGLKLSSNRRGPFEGWIYEQVVRASDVFGPPICTVLRRSVIDTFNLRFDPRIVIGPDWDFLTRFAERARFGYIDQPTCLYRVHETNITVQTDLKRRAGYLAICRENAIQTESFAEISLETREAVFYDLLVELLAGDPERQDEVTTWDQFTVLPDISKARLYRLMASKAIKKGAPRDAISRWLSAARRLDPKDKRSRILADLYRLSPTLLQRALAARQALSPRQNNLSPFQNLDS